MNIGSSTRLIYDKCAYEDRLQESTGPLMYTLDPNRIKNCNECLSLYGPRSSKKGFGVSIATPFGVAPAQDAVDVESILTNRNVLASKCKDGKVNDINVNNFRLQHARLCGDFLDPLASRQTNPAANYRGMSINRFFDLPKNPQADIFWNFAVNTTLEAKDNYREKIPKMISPDPLFPRTIIGRRRPCSIHCTNKCPTSCIGRAEPTN